MSEIANPKTFKSYIAFWSGQMFSLLGSSVVQFVIIFWILQITKSAVYLSIATFFAFLPQWILGPLVGVYIDRWNRKLIIALSDFFQAFTTFIIIMLFFLNVETVWAIIIINSVRGLCQAFHWPATNAIIPIMVPKEHLSRLNGLNFFFTGMVRTIGPVIAATLLAILTIEQVLWIDVITFLIAIAPLLIIKIPNVVKTTLDKVKKPFFKDLAEGIKVIRSIPGLLLLLYIATMINFFGQPFNTLIAYFVNVTHSGNKLDLGFVMALIQGGMFIGAIIITIKKNWKHKAIIIFLGLIIGDLGHLVLALAPTGQFIIIGIGGFVFAFIVPFVNTMFLTILQKTIPLEKQGRVMSIVITIATAVSPIAMIISGPLADIMGIVPLFVSAAVIDMIIVILIWIFSNVARIDYDELAISKTEEFNN
ncbi:MAG: MFS transporter [Candidatus Lokiarchaeota archaeon]|nr:MFS transporter [Candidatus Lokiarchaeota archaeon]